MSDHRKRILWIDNDTNHLYPYEMALQDAGYDVIIVETVSEGAAHIATHKFALVILDVMIAVTEDEERNDYSPERTDETHETGLVFYQKYRSVLKSRGIPLMAMTVRIDQGIADKFTNAGLPAECFVRKFEVRDSDTFLAKVKAVLAKFGAAGDNTPNA